MRTAVVDLQELVARTQREGAGLPAVTLASSTRAAAGSVLSVAEPLRPLFPAGGLRRGSTVQVGVRAGPVPLNVTRPVRSSRVEVEARGPGYPEPAAVGGCALLLALVAEASATGSWSAVVDAPGLGIAAAAETGIHLDRLALIPAPGRSWPRVIGALLEGFDLVAVRSPADLQASTARSLSARARHCGSVLLSLGPWPGAEVWLSPAEARWEGLSAGHGRLTARRVLVRGGGRGASGGPPRSVECWLPGRRAPVEAVYPADCRAAAGRSGMVYGRQVCHG